MAEIRPFRGLRFSAQAGSLKHLVAPPYDVLSPAEREAYGARSEHNIVHLTLPEQRDDDRSKFVKYARSAAALAEWRRDGALVLEEHPAFYRYEQTFTVPGYGERLTRTALIALIKVEPYERGVVLPHEQTFPKHKEDRLRILEATRSHLECIFGLYEDPDGRIHETIVEADGGGVVEVDSDEGVHHRLTPINDPETCAHIAELFRDRTVWIADGHHRYETAVTFRQALGEKEERIAEDYMMMALSSMADPGLVLLPTHRIVNTLPYGQDELRRRLEGHFNIEEHHPRRLPDLMAEKDRQGERVFAAALPGGVAWLLTPKDDAALVAGVDGEGSQSLKGLDVSILHSVILEKLLGVKGLDSISYTRDPAEAIAAVNQGEAVSFLMNPPTVDDMRTIALGGEKMPQKSTYYFPKILSGLVVWSLNDFP